jgi:dienelactone hydrolase
MSCCIAVQVAAQEATVQVLPGTKPLTLTGDIASELVAGVDRFLLRELERSVETRGPKWQRDFSSREAYIQSIELNRQKLAQMLGIRDAFATDTEPRMSSTVSQSSLVGRGNGYEIHAVTWPAFGDVHGRGLLLSPTTGTARMQVVAIPDCGVLPEQLVGLVPGVAPESQYARRLAENGCRVLVPMLINREEKLPGLTNREWLYRPAFELGRGLVGYEVQEVMAAVQWMKQSRVDPVKIGVFGWELNLETIRSLDGDPVKIGVFGWGEGGLIALYAGAIDTRIDVTGVSGYFDSRQNIWQEPIDRNVFGLLESFGDAELASLIAPRALIMEASRGAEAELPGGTGAPARVVTPKLEDVRAEFERARQLVAGLSPRPHFELVNSGNGMGPCGRANALQSFLQELGGKDEDFQSNEQPIENLLKDFRPEVRHQQQMHELDRHNQMVLRESHYVRQERTMGRFNFTSIADYERSAEPVRQFFYDDVIGRFDMSPLPTNARTRVFQETADWTGYEVVLDLFPDVMAYGLLLVPKDLQPGEKRPVVVCQHGLEGRPQDTIGEQGSHYYSAFSAKLAERGFVTFAPQNLYIFTDRFRTLQRKANPLKKTLYSVITPQHQQIVDWLQTLDFVDSQRIGFYGLSYGGKTAMRVPALVTDYCLSICSADFNEWVDKNASTRNPRTYANMGEYEIFEFDLGSTFNYGEMAALIAPRPFMVERGHFDSVADDWTVAYEYAKVRHLYAAQLKLPERTTIEWFDGPHKINGQGTFEFLHKHLNWPVRPGK